MYAPPQLQLVDFLSFLGCEGWTVGQGLENLDHNSTFAPQEVQEINHDTSSSVGI
jgi:hypothetical protein